MKFFTDKSFWSKIIILFIVIILFQFVIIRPSLAEPIDVNTPDNPETQKVKDKLDAEKKEEEDIDLADWGGILLEPILKFLMGVGDGLITFLHNSIMGQQRAIIKITTEEHGLFKFLTAAVVGVVTAALVYLTAGAAIAGLAALGMSVIATAATGIGIASGIACTCVTYNKLIEPEIRVPLFTYSPEEIFAGKILLFDVDFFNPTKNIYMKTKDGQDLLVSDMKEEDINEKEENKENGILYYYYTLSGKPTTGEEGAEEPIITSRQNTALELHKVISKWYYIIRNIVLILMMSVLLYIGIRMLLTTISSDKAKYKEMLKDWIVAIFILFLVHYIMAFSISLVKDLTLALSSTVDDDGDNYKFGGYIVNIKDDSGNILKNLLEISGKEIEENQDNGGYAPIKTNLMGKLRLESQVDDGTLTFIGSSICYLVLVIYTIVFTYTYLRRILYLAFLTIIAPFMALTYPIDKISDGSAQGFNKWMKEYLFNLLIQPLHLILYTILVSSAYELASTNVVYSIVCIGFMIPAEKLLRGLFGFEKASTPGNLAGAAVGAGLISTGINSIRKLNSSSSKKGNSDGDNSFDGNESNLREADIDATNIMAAELSGEKTDQEELEQEKTENPLSLGMGVPVDSTMGKSKLNFNAPIEDVLGKTEKGSTNNEKGAEKAIPSINKSKRPGIKGVMRYGGKKFVNKGKRAFKNLPRNSIRFAGKTMGAVGLGALAGTAGLVAGVASGDVGTAFKYASAGIGAGSMVGKSLGNKATQKTLDIMDSKGLKEAYYGEEEWKQMKKEKEIKEIKRENEEQYIKTLGIEKYNEMIKDQSLDKYIENGIADAKEIKVLEKMQKNGQVQSVEGAIALKQYADRMGDPRNMKKKDKDEWKSTFAEEFEKANYKNSKQLGEDTVDRVRDFYHNMHS